MSVEQWQVHLYERGKIIFFLSFLYTIEVSPKIKQEMVKEEMRAKMVFLLISRLMTYLLN